MSTPYRRNAKTPAGRIAATPSTANWGGFFGLLQQYAGAAAGYSLRKIGSGPVVRLRRGSDNTEKDFYAGDLTGSVVGSQVLLNPEFDSATGWSTSGGWSITGGQAVQSGTDGNLQQGGKLTVGNYYIVTLEIVACSNFDDLRIRFGAASVYSLSSIGITTTGTHQIAFQAQSTFFLIQTINSATATIEFAGCEEYTPTAAELWTIEGVGNTTQLFAYATTWYDQSGSGNDATQATDASQPLLIRAGVTNTENGKAALSFDGVDDELTASYSPSDYPITQTVVARGDATNAGYALSLHLSGQSDEYLTGSPVDASAVAIYSARTTGASANPSNAITANDYTLMFSYSSSSTSHSTHLNGGAAATSATSVTFPAPDTLAIGNLRDNTPLYFAGKIQEAIIYPSDQSSNRIGIEGNINDHYGIY